MKTRFWLSFGLLLAAMVVASGCSKCSDIQLANRLPQIKSFRFDPAGVMPGDTITAVVTGLDKEGDKFEIEYEWLVNGKKVPGSGETFQTDELPNGAIITVRFRAKEVNSGKYTEWEDRNIVLGAPAPPSLVGVDIEPMPLPAGRDATAVVDYGESSSADFNLFYRWTINGEEPEGDDFTGETLDGRYLTKGVQVQVSISDSEEFEGRIWSSATLTVTGFPPTFSGEPTIAVDGKSVVISYEVEDPDGDEVKVTLTGAPGGARQEKDGFRINLQGAEPGDYTLKLTATDDTGAGAEYEINMTVPKQGTPVVTGSEPVEPVEQPAEPEAPTGQPEQPTGQPEQPAGQPEETVEQPPVEPPPVEQPEEPAPAPEPVEPPEPPQPTYGGSE